eukprot:TRINITY_DN919_c0_g1_i1.p1 TRINITY_DN919_c0_g1~~TRINITY_DN919_c0_g1_i1.p1  ORF type:complete len:405 (-),score=94.13 TRINITY_DN919_c0_g1_i1:803-2017(-)
MRIVIVGGGAVGACCAYFLAQRCAAANGQGDDEIVVVEQSNDIANGASGKAGGFLAEGWCDSNESKELARKGFELHKELAQLLGPDVIEYREVQAVSAEANGFLCDKSSAATAAAGASSEGVLNGCEWLDQPGVVKDSIQVIDTPGETAQVHPEKFTKAMLEAAQKTGKVKLRLNTRVTGVVLSQSEDSKDQRTVRAVVFQDGETLEADHVILAMGPWTNNAFEWLESQGVPKPNDWSVESAKYQSILMQPSSEVPATAVFLSYQNAKRGKQEEPEIYPRPSGVVYMCGMRSFEDLPSDPSLVEPVAEECDKLFSIAQTISSNLTSANVIHTQACYLPMTHRKCPSNGKLEFYPHPIIGSLLPNLFVASGSNYWGILTSPAVGLAMCGLVLDQRSCINLTSFAP